MCPTSGTLQERLEGDWQSAKRMTRGNMTHMGRLEGLGLFREEKNKCKNFNSLEIHKELLQRGTKLLAISQWRGHEKSGLNYSKIQISHKAGISNETVSDSQDRLLLPHHWLGVWRASQGGVARNDRHRYTFLWAGQKPELPLKVPVNSLIVEGILFGCQNWADKLQNDTSME